MLLCNCDPDGTLSLTRDRLCCGWHPRGNFCSSLCFLLPAMCAIFRRPLRLAASVRRRVAVPFVLLRRFPFPSSPPAHPIRRQSVSQIAVVDDCSKLFSPLHCLSLLSPLSVPLALSPSVSTSAIALNPRLPAPVTAWPPSGKRWKTDNRKSKSPP